MKSSNESNFDSHRRSTAPLGNFPAGYSRGISSKIRPLKEKKSARVEGSRVCTKGPLKNLRSSFDDGSVRALQHYRATSVNGMRMGRWESQIFYYIYRILFAREVVDFFVADIIFFNAIQGLLGFYCSPLS